MIKGATDLKDMRAIIAGTIGEGTAREFIKYCEIYKGLITVDQILAAPDKVEVPAEPGTVYAVAGSIAHHANPKNIAPLMTFIERMPVEFQVITLKDAIRREQSLVQDPAIRSWVAKSAKELM